MSRRLAVAAVLGVPLLLAAVIVAASAWLLPTPGGLAWAAAQARHYLPEGITFERVEGRLAGPLEVYGLRVRDAGASVRVGRASLDWTPLALLTGRVRVTRLVLGPVDVELAPGEPAAGTTDGGAAPGLPAELPLPLRVAVDRAAVNDVRVRLPDGRVERIERLAVTVAAGPRRGLALSHLELATPRGDASGHLRLAPAAPFALAGGLDWRLPSPAPGVAAMAGRLELDGSLADLRARLAWREPAAATVALGRACSGDSRNGMRRWRCPTARCAPGGTRPRPWTRARSCAWTGPWSVPRCPATSASTACRPGCWRRGWTRPRARMVSRSSTCAWGTPRRPDAEVLAEGRIGLGPGPPQLDLELQWRRLGWPLEAPAEVTSESGRASLRGTPDDYRLAGSARLRTGPTGDMPVRARLDGRGSATGLRGLRLDAAWRGARLDATVESLRWAAPGEARARLELADLDPGAFVPALAGRLGARARLEASWGDVARVRVVLERLDGELHGQALEGGGTVSYGAEGLRIERLVLRAGAASARVGGRLTQSGLALDWQLDIPELGALVARHGGRLRGDGRVTGTPAAPRVRGELEARDPLVAPGVSIDEGAWRACSPRRPGSAPTCAWPCAGRRPRRGR
ncbi:MAG: hypothetical protein U5K43_12825 [Halofilum sp. (in: g-proteobacteria)]|nr:hypothetical protein [Halofilum sp. (in: g-proteobacteria)]